METYQITIYKKLQLKKIKISNIQTLQQWGLKTHRSYCTRQLSLLELLNPKINPSKTLCKCILTISSKDTVPLLQKEKLINDHRLIRESMLQIKARLLSWQNSERIKRRRTTQYDYRKSQWRRRSERIHLVEVSVIRTAVTTKLTCRTRMARMPCLNSNQIRTNSLGPRASLILKYLRSNTNACYTCRIRCEASKLAR